MDTILYHLNQAESILDFIKDNSKHVIEKNKVYIGLDEDDKPKFLFLDFAFYSTDDDYEFEYFFVSLIQGKIQHVIHGSFRNESGIDYFNEDILFFNQGIFLDAWNRCLTLDEDSDESNLYIKEYDSILKFRTVTSELYRISGSRFNIDFVNMKLEIQ